MLYRYNWPVWSAKLKTKYGTIDETSFNDINGTHPNEV